MFLSIYVYVSSWFGREVKLFVAWVTLQYVFVWYRIWMIRVICTYKYFHANLSNHLNLILRINVLRCDLCWKRFCFFSKLARHKHSHSGKNLINASCFTLFAGLTKHNWGHNGEELFQCSLCQKACTQSGNSTVHKCIHSGDQSFQCSLCLKLF